MSKSNRRRPRLGPLAFAGAVWLALFACLPRPLRADIVHPRAGTSSAAFLKIPVGARPVAMGEAFTAISDDVNALYWNPAGLTSLDLPVIGATHQESYEGITHEFFGFASPLRFTRDGQKVRAPYRMAWGVGIIFLSVPGDLERRSGINEGGAALGQITTPEGSFGATDMAANVSFAMRYNKNNYGVNLKFIRQTIDTVSGHTAALDLGWKRDDVWIENLSFGALIQNLGPGIAFDQAWFPLPLTFRTGVAYTIDPIRTKIALDVSKPRDDFPIFGLGGEIAVRKYLFFRGGYRYRVHGNPLGFLSGWRTGVGLVYRNFTLDYAIAPFGELGNSHRVSLGYRFGARAARVLPIPAAFARSAPKKTAPKDHYKIPTTAKRNQAVGTLDYVSYSIKAIPKIISARGSDFLIIASAPSGGDALREVSFRIVLPSPNGLKFETAVAPGKHLPKDYKTERVYWLRLNIEPVMRAVKITMDGTPDQTIFGLFGWEWRPLPTRVAKSGGKTVLKARSNIFPQAVAVGGK